MEAWHISHLDTLLGAGYRLTFEQYGERVCIVASLPGQEGGDAGAMQRLVGTICAAHAATLPVA